VNNFSLTTKAADDNIAVMMPKGYINDLGAERLEQTSEQILGKGLKKLVVNFSDVQFINTIGVSIFTGIIHKTQEYKGMLCFTNMKKVHRDVFEMVGLIQHVKVFKDEEEALEFLNERGSHDK
jgi:anti-sigma B factor antagonist